MGANDTVVICELSKPIEAAPLLLARGAVYLMLHARRWPHQITPAGPKSGRTQTVATGLPAGLAVHFALGKWATGTLAPAGTAGLQRGIAFGGSRRLAKQLGRCQAPGTSTN